MANQSVSISKTIIDKAPTPEKGQLFIRDANIKGFGVRITTKGTKSFIFEKRVNGQVRRITIGKYGALTVDQAKKRAIQLAGQIVSGFDPIAEKKRILSEAVTLGQAYEAFLKARKDLKATTLREYNRTINRTLESWKGKRLVDISKAMISKKHLELGTHSGEAYANLTMRNLRAIFNFSLATYDDGKGNSILSENPVNILSQTRAWYRIERRQTVIRVPELPAWYEAVMALRNGELTEKSRANQEVNSEHVKLAKTIADLLIVLLFTGLRRNEASSLQWTQIDFDAKTLHLPDPKNRKPFTLPLSNFIMELLKERFDESESKYVFPSRNGQSFLKEPKKGIKKVCDKSGLIFSPHDLRRTFITIGDSLDTPPLTLRRLANHATHNDVTDGYIISDVERLRGPMQKISDFIEKNIN